MKTIYSSIGLTILVALLSLLLLIIIFFLDGMLSQPLLSGVKSLRGTLHYEGETAAEELMIIYTMIIYPLLMVIVGSLVWRKFKY